MWANHKWVEIHSGRYLCFSVGDHPPVCEDGTWKQPKPRGNRAARVQHLLRIYWHDPHSQDEGSAKVVNSGIWKVPLAQLQRSGKGWKGIRDWKVLKIVGIFFFPIWVQGWLLSGISGAYGIFELRDVLLQVLRTGMDMNFTMVFESKDEKRWLEHGD